MCACVCVCVCVCERERERVDVCAWREGGMCVAKGTKTCLRNVQSLSVVFRIKHWCGGSGVAHFILPYSNFIWTAGCDSFRKFSPKVL